MKSKVIARFIGGVDSTFKNDKGEEIAFRQGRFGIPGEMETPIFRFPAELDTSLLEPFQTAYLVVDFRYNDQYKNFKGYVDAIYPDEKSLNAAQIGGGYQPGSYLASAQSGKDSK